MIYLRGHHLRLLYSYLQAKKCDYRLQNKKNKIIKTALDDRQKILHGKNIIKTLEKALQPKEKIKLIDTIDDICDTCNRKSKQTCKEFIPYNISATSDDRSTLYFYGLQKRVYTSEFIKKRLLEKKEFL